jgi:glycosyltransferase involved in cell wall biosynthesis
MGYGNCVLTLATPENIEAVGQAGIAYSDESDLVEKLQKVLRDGSLVHAFRNRAQLRVKQHYDWDKVVDQYEHLFARMAGVSPSTQPVEREMTYPEEVTLSR